MENKRASFGFRNRYFEGYARKIVLSDRGKAHVEYVYEGNYYTALCTDSVWIWHKVLYLLLTAAAVVGQLTAMAAASDINRIRLITAIQAIGLLLLLSLGVGAFSRASAPRNMTRWEFRTAVQTLRECSALYLCLQAVLLAAALLLAAAGTVSPDGQWLIFLGCTLFSVCMAVLLHRSVKKEQYRQELSDDIPHGTDITGDFMPGL